MALYWLGFLFLFFFAQNFADLIFCDDAPNWLQKNALILNDVSWFLTISHSIQIFCYETVRVYMVK